LLVSQVFSAQSIQHHFQVCGGSNHKFCWCR